MGIKEEYKNKWAREQSEQSEHPYEFWIDIVDMLFENRTIQKLDLFTPLGNWTSNWTVFGFLVQIDNAGIKIEKEQGMEKAFAIFEVCIAENFPGTYPYDRLRIWYTKNKKYLDAMRVCRAYINIPDRPHGQAKDGFIHHLKKLGEKLDRQNQKS